MEPIHPRHIAAMIGADQEFVRYQRWKRIFNSFQTLPGKNRFFAPYETAHQLAGWFDISGLRYVLIETVGGYTFNVYGELEQITLEF